MSITSLTPIQLRKAADLQEKIAALQTELAAILASEVPSGKKKDAVAKSKSKAKIHLVKNEPPKAAVNQ